MTRRLLLSYLSLAALVLLGLEIPLGFVYSRAERERIVNAANDEAESVAAYTALSLAAGRQDELAERARHCAERIGGKVVIVDADGNLLASSHSLSDDEEKTLPTQPEISAALRGRATTDVRTTTTGGVHYLAVAAPVGHATPETGPRPGDERAPGAGSVTVADSTPSTASATTADTAAGATTVTAQGAVRVTLPTTMVHARVFAVWLLLALAGLAVLTGVAAVAFAFARWTGRPIRQLEEATHRLAEGGRATSVVVTSGPPEVRSLAAAFNTTAARLEHLLASQRAFAGEASHQLKTPLAALRLRLENLEPDIARRARPSLDAAVTETDRLARMVEGLLAMARLEEAAAIPAQVDLGAICAERHRTWGPLFERGGVSLVLFAGVVGPVTAVPGAVEQILDNLLSNALRASPTHSTVTMELRLHVPARRALREARPHWVDLHVTDEGPGMTPEQRARAFDRFWRAPGAPKGGTGLGLSLVQRLAHASGGEVTLREAATGGLDAVVRLPSAEHPGQAPGNGHGQGQGHGHGHGFGGRQGQRRREAPPLPA
ncbi:MULTISPECIES: sensor histidine kinase [Streptomyces]|uniref:sensor histidine kinase n=1 Tax=Streptomyces scabiei TaxID=1930 RepID=UPI001B301269|nr:MULTISPECIES: ATP-binding protein [Streptomyces]MBP5893798.1 HAMP domain-containing protein [Streptomyces sp. LBUM 1481]MBP5917011.1 HAMP domain-containing protein [Streptomyces sp. LBUM 1486]MBP5924047.1 HAMP domain-containing protein [Streptomyces sp. LBUM 1483]MDX2690950.1 ATP-binding protein [Streptomyces scabiei]MDX2755923.1 ATP-binding protein [Streptomyces scabiei]